MQNTQVSSKCLYVISISIAGAISLKVKGEKQAGIRVDRVWGKSILLISTVTGFTVLHFAILFYFKIFDTLDVSGWPVFP